MPEATSDEITAVGPDVAERAIWDNEGGHLTARSGHIVQTPDADQPYKVVLAHEHGPSTEQPCATIREGETIIRESTPARKLRDTSRDQGASTPREPARAGSGAGTRPPHAADAGPGPIAGPDQPDAVLDGPLVPANDMRGKVVNGRDGDRLGTIDRLILDAPSGRVAFVILSTGGFLGLGQSYHPIPWRALRYDPASGGYTVSIDRRLLEGAPSFRPDSAPVFDQAYGRRVTDYYRPIAETS